MHTNGTMNAFKKFSLFVAIQLPLGMLLHEKSARSPHAPPQSKILFRLHTKIPHHN